VCVTICMQVYGSYRDVCLPVVSQVSMFAIKDGRVFFRNKFVRTEALMREQEAQKVRQRGPRHGLHAKGAQKLCW